MHYVQIVEFEQYKHPYILLEHGMHVCEDDDMFVIRY